MLPNVGLGLNNEIKKKLPKRDSIKYCASYRLLNKLYFMMKRGITIFRGALSTPKQRLRSHKQGLAIPNSQPQAKASFAGNQEDNILL